MFMMVYVSCHEVVIWFYKFWPSGKSCYEFEPKKVSTRLLSMQRQAIRTLRHLYHQQRAHRQVVSVWTKSWLERNLHKHLGFCCLECDHQIRQAADGCNHKSIITHQLLCRLFFRVGYATLPLKWKRLLNRRNSPQLSLSHAFVLHKESH